MSMPGWMRNMLHDRHVPFEELHHRQAFTAQQVAAAEHVSGHRLAKVVVVMADERPVELVLPASRRVVLEEVRQMLGARTVRLASEQEMARMFPDCEVGAIPPLEHWVNVPIIVDRSLERDGDIVLQAGTHEDAIRLSYADWYDMVRPRLGTFTEVMH